MSVLVKDMEMPQNCTECKIKGEGSDSLYTWSCPFTGFEYTRYDCLNDRLDDCPLIEVKLVDQEEVITPLNMIGGYLEKVKENENENNNV